MSRSHAIGADGVVAHEKHKVASDQPALRFLTNYYFARPPLLSRRGIPFGCGFAAILLSFWLTGSLYGQCGTCHGEDGNSKIKNIPSLAGQPEFFLLNQLVLMRAGVRQIESMKPFVKDLKDADIESLAKHFAALEPRMSDEKIDPALAQRGAELAKSLRCASCHLPSFAGRQQIPRLARQRVDYLIHSMKEFRDNKRSGADTLMSNAVAGLSDADLTALAHYAASIESSKQ